MPIVTTFTVGGGGVTEGVGAATATGAAPASDVLASARDAAAEATGAAATTCAGATEAPRVGEGCVDEHAGSARTTARTPERVMW
jgi:hypothetical protein